MKQKTLSPDSQQTQINHLTLEETQPQSAVGFSYRTDLCNLHSLPDNTFPWHWHNEVEFFYMRKGELDYLLPSGTYTFREGEGGFINVGVLHATSCKEALPCIQEEHIFLPQFIGGQENSIFMEKYIKPIVYSSSFELFHLYPSQPEHKKIIELLSESYDFYIQKPEGYEFDIRNNMSQAWKQLFLLAREELSLKTSGLVSNRIKAMMEYISLHYGEKLTLQQIAASGFISERECNRCFRESVGLTPFSYLMDYRLYKACDLLTHTPLSVTDIAVACGFSSSSYFGRLFREKFLYTPKEYRKRYRKQP